MSRQTSHEQGAECAEHRASRHSRHLRLAEVGPAGLSRWAAAPLRVLGDGAAARAATLYLAAAGLRRLEAPDLQSSDAADGLGPGWAQAWNLAGVGPLAAGAGAPELDLRPQQALAPVEALRGALAATGVLLRLLGLGERAPLPDFAAPGELIPGGARVLVVGAGGLGSPALLGLALAGARRFTVVDDDVVERSNLPRQILHGTDRLALPKAESAARTLRAAFPGVEVRALRARFVGANAVALCEQHDLVLEASDNFPTKFRANAAALEAGVPAVVAGVLRFEGQALAVSPADERAACYRCLFPDEPGMGELPTCSSVGVLGPVAGALGLWQALLGWSLLAGRADAVAGRLWTFDARAGRWAGYRASQRPDCVACGPEADDPALRG